MPGDSESLLPGAGRPKPGLLARIRAALTKALPVGVIVVLGNAAVSHYYWTLQQELSHSNWLRQQEYTEAMAERRRRADAAENVRAELSHKVGGLITAAAVIADAYERRAPKDHLNRQLESHNLLQQAWDLEDDNLLRTMEDSFPYDDIRRPWQQLRDMLDELDGTTAALVALETTDRSAARDQALAASRQQIATTKEQLASLTAAMRALIPPIRPQ